MKLALVIALALGAGCLDSSVTTCEDGTLCPAGTVCSSQGCVLPEQVDACVALDDGDRCTFSGVTNGACVDGVCVSFGCGNDVVEEDQGEVCDDGNTASGDGCRADCQKLEVCGDEVEDEGEACDDGNGNTADGCDACARTTWAATAIVGGDVAGTSVVLAFPRGVAVDVFGNVYFADSGNHRIRRVDAVGGVITTLAGTGVFAFSGDGGAATSAELDSPSAVAVDGLGNVFIADTQNHRTRRVDAGTGVITTVAGTGVLGSAGDGAAATSAQLRDPYGVAVDGLGNLYIADWAAHRIRRVDADTGIITTVAGTGTPGYSGDGGQAIVAELAGPIGVAVDALGNLYIAEKDNHCIRRVDVAGIISTVAGTGIPGFSDGVATTAQLDNPRSVVVDALGNLYIADYLNHRIRHVDLGTGMITTVAGTGTAGFSGDSGAATLADLDSPRGVAVDGLGTFYIADTDNQRIRRVDGGSGLISTIAGNGATRSAGDGGVATSAQLTFPKTVAVDSTGAVYIADSDNHRLRRVDAGGVITTVAGSGVQGSAGDGGAATSAELSNPYGLARDGLGNLYLADTSSHRVRRVDAVTGVITTFAGTGTAGFSADGVAATSSQLNFPHSVAVDGLGHVYIADTLNYRIRRVDAVTGVITTVAGTGVLGSSGDTGPATSALLNYPTGVATDSLGNLYIADQQNHRVRRVDAGTGVITRVAGMVQGSSGDGGLATLAQLRAPFGVTVDALGTLYIADTGNHRIRRVDPGTAIITTIAGTGTSVFSGDGGLATDAGLRSPNGVAADGLGNLYVVDTNSHRIRRVVLGTGIITTIAGQLDPERMGPLAKAQLADPRALVLAPPWAFIAGGTSGTVQEVRHDDGWLEVVAGRYPQPIATSNLARFRASTFGRVGGVAHDATAGVIYLSETTSNRLHVVTLVDPLDERTWTIATLAGDGTAGFADGAVASARFRAPSGLFLDEVAQVLYVADTGNHVIRAIDLATSTVTTIAGTPATLGFFGDTGLATEALLYQPEAITRCGNGDLFVADTGNHRVRRITGGVITTVLGDGVAASSGQGTPARDFPVREPRGLACDATGNLYVTSSTTVRQVAADELGVVDGSLRVSSIFGEPPRSEFPASVTYCLSGLAIVDDTSLQITDSCTGMLIELRRGAP